MAKLTTIISFTGSLSNVSAYKRRDSDKTILRMKGGPSKKTIETKASCAVVRQNNMEFGGRSTAAKYIRKVIHPLDALATINTASFLGKALVPAQQLDTVNPRGKRSVLLSKQPQIIEGFDLNRDNVFSTIIRTPLYHNLSKTSLETKLEIPALLPGINFILPDSYPLFSIIATIGAVPDVICRGGKYWPAVNPDISDRKFLTAETAWLPCSNGMPPTTLDLTMTQLPAGNAWSLLLGVGIRFATIGPDGLPKQIPYSGAGKILGMA